jgi:hypothetical protein
MLRSIPNFLTFAVITLNRVKMKNLIKFCAVILLVFIGCKNEKGMKNTKQEARLEIQSFYYFCVKMKKV